MNTKNLFLAIGQRKKKGFCFFFSLFFNLIQKYAAKKKFSSKEEEIKFKISIQ
jgi:hypothetical protein